MMKYIWTIVIASIIGIVASTYSVYSHYDTSESFCSIGVSFDCDLVNRSIYSTILGIPVGVIGIVGYVAMIVLALIYARRRDLIALNLMVFGAVFGTLFTLYLTAIEAFVLKTWCLVCITSQLMMLTVAIAVFLLQYYERRGVEEVGPKEIHE